jgi:preprotein translocase subunit SecY
MVSAAERLASGMNFEVLSRATELKQRLLFVLGALIVARIGSYIPIPGVDPQILKEIFAAQSHGMLGMFNVFAGGSLERMTIFALGIMPYISASIIMQLLTMALPYFAQMKKEGEVGRRKMNQYTRYGTVALTIIQGFGIALGLEAMTTSTGQSAVIDAGIIFRFTAITTMLGGTLFLMWLGEQITARGIGNGISLIIFVGIVASFPSSFAGMIDLGRRAVVPTELVILVLVGLISLFAFIVFMERAQRRIVVQHPKRQVGNKLYQGQNTHMPIKLNMAGVIPPIFASAILTLLFMLAGLAATNPSLSWLSGITAYLQHGEPLYIVVFTLIIVFFSFFYTSAMFNVEELAENLKKNGAYIPGIRPGKQTAEYLDFVATRLTVIGALYLAFVCVLPDLVISKYSLPLFLGGTSLLIIVSVVMDFVAQVQSHLFAHQYEGLLKKAKLRGGRA